MLENDGGSADSPRPANWDASTRHLNDAAATRDESGREGVHALDRDRLTMSMHKDRHRQVKHVLTCNLCKPWVCLWKKQGCIKGNLGEVEKKDVPPGFGCVGVADACCGALCSRHLLLNMPWCGYNGVFRSRRSLMLHTSTTQPRPSSQR